jgi:SIR2-like domain
MAQPPYRIIWERLLQGRVIPFFGAGASMSGRPAMSEWTNKTSAFPPSGRELSRELAKDSEFPASDPREEEDLAKVSSYYVEASGRKILREKLRSVLDHSYPVGSLHRLLAQAAKATPLMIVTTNYDALIESALAAEGVDHDLVIYDTDSLEYQNCVQVRKSLADGSSTFEFQPSNRVSLPKVDLPDGYWQFEKTVVFKMHGSISPAKRELDSFVITEEDYIGFLSRFSQSSAIPSQFLTYFRQCSFLFLGYGLADWNLRVVLNNLRSYLPESEGGKSWAIQRDVSLLESTLWAKRGVNLYELDLDQFTSRLEGVAQT